MVRAVEGTYRMSGPVIRKTIKGPPSKKISTTLFETFSKSKVSMVFQRLC